MSRKAFVLLLFAVIGILLLANLFFIYAGMIQAEHYSFGWRFYFDRRMNFPFYFSLFLLLLNIVLLTRIANRPDLSRSQKIFWSTLLITFILFATDEAFYIHQHFKMSTFGRIASYDRASLSHYVWMIPYFVVFGGLMAVMFRFSHDIPHPTRRRLVFAAAVFLIGAVCMEFLGTYYFVINPRIDLNLLLIKTGEAVLQMTGAVMFVNIFINNLDIGQ